MLIGGWQAGTIFTMQDGFPLSAFCGSGAIQNNDSGCYPDNTGSSPNLSRGQQDPSHFFNLAAFMNRLPGDPQFRYGNSGRNTLIGPGVISWDFSTLKLFPITERRNLEFRFEAFNLPNHPNWGLPNANFSSSSFGKVTSTATNMRELQFSLKLNF